MKTLILVGLFIACAVPVDAEVVEEGGYPCGVTHGNETVSACAMLPVDCRGGPLDPSREAARCDVPALGGCSVPMRCIREVVEEYT